jgi:glycerol uptake facilitator protein
MSVAAHSLSKRCLAEVLGTFILVFFGCGAVHAAVLTGAQSGLWQVAIVWGVAIMAAAYTVGSVSGAHINPAITIALTMWGRFSWSQAGPYIVSQVAGGILGAAALFAVYTPFLAERERELNVTRGQPGSEVTAMCYGEYYPNPSLTATTPLYVQNQTERLSELVPTASAFGIEVLGTLLLALVVFAVTDEDNLPLPIGRLAPVFIGLTVAILISVIAPLTQACFNPARDFGPRLFAAIAGWGRVAIPGPNGSGFFTVYILAPILGALLGGGLYTRVLRARPYQGKEKESLVV